MRKWLSALGFAVLLFTALTAFPRFAPRLYLASFGNHSVLIANQDTAISALFQELAKEGDVTCTAFVFYGFPSPWGNTVPIYTPEPHNLLLTHADIAAEFPYASTDILSAQRVKSMELVANFNSMLLQKCPQIAGEF